MSGTGAFEARELLYDVRAGMVEVAEDATARQRDAQERQQDAERREQRSRRAVLVSVAVGVAASLIGAVIAVVAATTTSERVAPEITRQVIADSRAQRVANARGVLDAANRILADRGLPMVADPGPTANAEQVLAAASSAQVLSVLPEDIVQQLRDQLDGRPLMLPSATAAPVPPDGEPGAPGGAGPNVTTTPPGRSPGGVAPGPGGGGVQPAPPPGRTVAPPPREQPQAPPETRRRLLPQLVPLPLPLIGT